MDWLSIVLILFIILTAVLEFRYHIPCYCMMMKFLMDLIFVIFVYVAPIVQFIATTSFQLASRILEELPRIANNTFNLLVSYALLAYEGVFYVTKLLITTVASMAIVLKNFVIDTLMLLSRLVAPYALFALAGVFRVTKILITSVASLAVDLKNFVINTLMLLSHLVVPYALLAYDGVVHVTKLLITSVGSQAVVLKNFVIDKLMMIWRPSGKQQMTDFRGKLESFDF